VPCAGLREAQRMICENQHLVCFGLCIVIEEEEDASILANSADEAEHRLLVLENVLVVRIGATEVVETDLPLHAPQVALDDALHDLRHALALVHVRIDDLVEELGGAGDAEGEDMSLDDVVHASLPDDAVEVTQIAGPLHLDGAVL